MRRMADDFKYGKLPCNDPRECVSRFPIPGLSNDIRTTRNLILIKVFRLPNATVFRRSFKGF